LGLLLLLQVWCWSARSRHCRSRDQDPAGVSRRRTIRYRRCRQYRGRDKVQHEDTGLQEGTTYEEAALPW
ncbi:hypothetical protein CLOP_g9169, partial [Closterium sp. NIES-67]